VRRTEIVAGGVVLALAVIFLAARGSKAPVFVSPQSMTTTAAKVGPAWAYPDPTRTPGLTNREITQGNIQQTICNSKWTTASIRPPVSYTTHLKKKQIQQWDLPGTVADYEEDHLISLELGGNPTDPRNLWPEPFSPIPGAREKDVVEKYLHAQVCAGTMRLEEAQTAIVGDWYRVYVQIDRRGSLRKQRRRSQESAMH
jgi:hypothetical protein